MRAQGLLDVWMVLYIIKEMKTNDNMFKTVPSTFGGFGMWKHTPGDFKH